MKLNFDDKSTCKINVKRMFLFAPTCIKHPDIRKVKVSFSCRSFLPSCFYFSYLSFVFLYQTISNQIFASHRHRRGSDGFHLNSRVCNLYETGDGSFIRGLSLFCFIFVICCCHAFIAGNDSWLETCLVGEKQSLFLAFLVFELDYCFLCVFVSSCILSVFWFVLHSSGRSFLPPWVCCLAVCLSSFGPSTCPSVLLTSPFSPRSFFGT